MIAALLFGLFLLPLLTLALASKLPTEGQRELLPNVGATVDSTLRAIDMTHKEAALICGMDFAQWSRGVNGLGPLDLHKLARLPWRFQGVWLQKYVQLCLVFWLAEMKTDLKERVRCD